MIVKSMSRKAPTFSQLASYIGQGSVGKSADCFSRNLYYDGGDQKVVAGIFYTNYGYLPPRKNGSALYHEVLVLPTQSHLTKAQQTKILLDLARKYCELRAPWQLAWGRVHFDTKCPHVHLMISANTIHSPKRERLDRQSFARIQSQLETYKTECFPELSDTIVYNRSTMNQNLKVNKAEGEMVRRTRKLSHKQITAQKLEAAFASSPDLATAKAILLEQGYALYQRGKVWGVECLNGRKRYRLATLGLAQSFATIIHLQQNQIGNKPVVEIDNRAARLLKQREILEAHAQSQLDKFERDQSEDYER